MHSFIAKVSLSLFSEHGIQDLWTTPRAMFKPPSFTYTHGTFSRHRRPSSQRASDLLSFAVCIAEVLYR